MELQPPTTKSSQPQPLKNASRNAQPVLQKFGTHHQILQLQRTLGNRAVGRLIQAKLAIDAPGDKYEQEADRVAETVMRMPDPPMMRRGEEDEKKIPRKPLFEQITPPVQRQVAEDEEETLQRQSLFETNTPVIQRVSVAVREDDEEKKLQTKPITLQRRCPECEREKEKEEGTVQRAISSTPTFIIQRLCPECEKKLQRQPMPEDEEEKPVQTKLFAPSIQSKRQAWPIQRKSTNGHSAPASQNVEANISAMRGGGSPLSAPTRNFFESRFGADFSSVRLHTDSRAAETSQSINARAFTVGSDIAFGTGQYAPETSSGKSLLAHELTHVIQQKAGPVSGTPIGGRLAVSDAADSYEQAASQTASVMAEKLSDQALQQESPRPNSPTYHTIRGAFIQRNDTATAPVTAEQIIDKHTNWIGDLDEKKLGEELASRLPGQSTLAKEVINKLPKSDKDDVAYETTNASGGKLKAIDETLRMTFVEAMVHGVVTDEEEGAIANIWISFDPKLPEVAEQHGDLWKKSLWESDQLVEHIKPISDSFAADVRGLAREYLKENKRSLLSERQRYGIDLEKKQGVEPSHPKYLEAVRAMVPGVVKLKNYLDELRQIHVGYKTQCHPRGGCFDTSVSFDPESKPAKAPKKTESPPWPTWEQVKTQYDRASAAISAFASIYPTIYILIQQDRLGDLDQAADASKAQQVILETLQKVGEKIEEADQKIAFKKITHYDLKMIQSQLLSGSAKVAYDPKYPWDKTFYQDIANDDIKGHDAHEFWVDMGMSLVAAAALIAAPFTGGATAVFLVGFGVGIGVGQAGMSWDKYLNLSTLGDSNVKEELALVAKGEVSAALISAIIQTVAVFLDIYGAKAATAGARASREALEAAEKGLKEQMAKEARNKLIRDAAKDTAMTIGGAGLAIGLQELEDDEPVPDMEAVAGQWQVNLGPEQPDNSPATVSRMVIQRAPASGAMPPGASAKQPIMLTGGEFEIHIEKALLKGPMGDLPQMSFVIPGQYTGSGWGIDRIGIVFDDSNGLIDVYHLEMKFVMPGSPHVPELGTPIVGTQTGKAWTKKAVDGFLTSQHPTARAGRERLRRAMQKMHPGETIEIERMRSFLHGKLVGAPVRVIVPHWADFSKLYKQVAALVRAGRDIRLLKFRPK